MLCKIANFHKIGKFSELHFFLINQMRCCSRLGHLPYLIILKFTQIYVDGINLLTHLRRQIVIRNFPNKAKHCFVCTLLVVSQHWFDNDMEVKFSKLLENFLSRHNNDSNASKCLEIVNLGPRPVERLNCTVLSRFKQVATVLIY